jgi:hypothetical protein
MKEESVSIWPAVMTNILVWMNFTTCAWELKKTIFDKQESAQHQIEIGSFKVANLDNKQSKINLYQDKEKTIFYYEPCSKIQKEIK